MQFASLQKSCTAAVIWRMASALQITTGAPEPPPRRRHSWSSRRRSSLVTIPQTHRRSLYGPLETVNKIMMYIHCFIIYFQQPYFTVSRVFMYFVVFICGTNFCKRNMAVELIFGMKQCVIVNSGKVLYCAGSALNNLSCCLNKEISKNWPVSVLGCLGLLDFGNIQQDMTSYDSQIDKSDMTTYEYGEYLENKVRYKVLDFVQDVTDFKFVR